MKKDITVDTVTATTVTTGDTKMDTNGVTIKDSANEATKLTKDGLQINDGGNKAVTINKDGLTIENGPKVTKKAVSIRLIRESTNAWLMALLALVARTL